MYTDSQQELVRIFFFLTFQQGESNDLTNNLPIHFYLTIFLKDFVANC